jgi:hypothetical protein
LRLFGASFEFTFGFYDDELAIKFESRVGNRLLDKLRAADGVADERLRRVLINAQMSGFGG